MIKDKGDIHQAFSPSEGLVDELVIIVGIFVKYAALCRRIGLDGETVLGQGNEAFDLYKRICPAWLEEESEGHETESYVYAQTVTGQASGELGHTKNRWITGTAFWTVNMVTVRKQWSLMGGNIIKQDILIVLSPKENPEQLSSMLASHGFTATTAQNVQTAFEYLNSHISAFLLLDLDFEGAISFLEQVWNEDYQFATTSVSDHISALRKKLGLSARDNHYIQTVRGAGYRFAPPE